MVLLREVARTGTIASAAEALSYSSSAVSQQLSRLQAELGISLLEHTGRNVFLTPAATLLVQRVEALLNIVEDIDAEVTTAIRGGHQYVRIGAFQSFTSLYAPGLAASVREHSPQLDVTLRQVEPDMAMNELNARRLDLVIMDEFPGLPAPRAPHVQRELLTSERLVPYYSKKFGKEADLDLSTLPWVSEPRGTATYDLVINICREHGFEPVIKFESADFETHRQLVEVGAAAAFLPEKFLRRRPKGAQPIAAMADGLERQIYTVVREGAQHYPAIQLLRGLISEKVL